MSNKKTKTLLVNTGIFAIANILTKVISFILVPLFTYYLSTEEYGIIDTITVTSSLLLPLMTVCIYEAVLRFGMKKGIDKNEVMTASLFIVFCGVLVLLLAYPFVSRIFGIKLLYLQFCLILVFDEIISILNTFAKTIGKIAECAILSVIRTIVYLSLSILFVTVLRLKVDGYLVAIIISQFITISIYVLKEKIWIYVNSYICFDLLKSMLSYSIPLMINGVMWWVMQSSDKYEIIYFLGMSSAGIYAVANKVPSIITMLHSTFFQAWQLSAIEEFNSNDAARYYSMIFNKYANIAFLVSICLIISVKPIFLYVLQSSYKVSWQYTLLLILASLFYSFSSFFGSVYSASERTMGALVTSTVGAILNIVLNFALIPFIGIQGASLTTFISYFVMWMLRVIDTRRIIRIRIKWDQLSVNFIFTVVLIILSLYGSIIQLYLIGLIGIVIVCIFIYKDLKEKI